MALISELETRVTADTSQYDRAMDRVEQKTAKVSKGVGILGKSLAAGALAIFSQQFINQTKKFAAEFDRLAKNASKLNITTTALQELNYAAELSGVSTTQLSTSLQRMTRRVSEAAKGTGAAKKALEELGFDAKALVQLSPDQQFRAIGNSLAKITNQSDKVRLTMKIFDKEGVGLINTFNQSLDKTAEEFQRLGLSVSDSDIKKMEKMTDQFTIMSLQVKKVSASLVAAFGPIVVSVLSKALSVINSIATRITEVLGGIDELLRKAVGAKDYNFENAGIEATRTVTKNQILAKNIATGKDSTYNRSLELLKNGINGPESKTAESLKKLNEAADKLKVNFEQMNSNVNSFFTNTNKNLADSELTRILDPIRKESEAQIAKNRNPAFDNAVRETAKLINNSRGLTGAARETALANVNQSIAGLRGFGQNMAVGYGNGTYSTFGGGVANTAVQRSIVGELEKFSKEVLGSNKSEVVLKIETDSDLIVTKVVTNKEFKGQVINVGKELAAQEAQSTAARGG